MMTTDPITEASLPIGLSEPEVDNDNITDWCLEQFHEAYNDESITKDDIWEYMYGVMHAPDWREKYKHDLQRSLPRIPFASDFEAFRSAGRHLMDLHVGYETCPEAEEVQCVVEYDQGTFAETNGNTYDAKAFRIQKKMRWGKMPNPTDPEGKKVTDKSVLQINDHCRLVGIPPEAHDYKVSGRSPLDWAVDSLRHKEDKASGITDDPNGWHMWANDPFELVRHLRRLAYVGIRSAEIINSLPPSLNGQSPDGSGDVGE